MASHLKDGAATRAAVFGKTEPRIKKTSVVHTELAHLGVDGYHLSRKIRWDVNLLLRRKNIELMRIENYSAILSSMNRFPIFCWVI